MDFYLFNFIAGLTRKHWLIDYSGVFLAEYLGYFLVLGIILFLIIEKNWRRRIYFFSLAAISVILARGIIVETIRFFYDRPRPFETLGIEPLILNNGAPSFPSGHAAFFFALALVVFFMNKKRGYWFFAGALLIGVARIFIGIHWPLDILAGAVAGLASAFAVKKIFSFSDAAFPEVEKKETPINQVIGV